MGRLLIQFAGTNTTKALSETLPKNTIIVDEDLHQLRLHDGTTAGGHIIGGSGGGGVPVGTIIPFAGNSIPEGYLLCDGSAISRTDYATLFAVIGTIYGTGDGNSTFNLPNLNDRLPRMPSNHTIGGTNEGWAPDIQGEFQVIFHSDSWSQIASGSFYPKGTPPVAHIGGGNYCLNYTLDFMASRSWTGYNSSVTNIMARNLCMLFIIKYI